MQILGHFLNATNQFIRNYNSVDVVQLNSCLNVKFLNQLNFFSLNPLLVS